MSCSTCRVMSISQSVRDASSTPELWKSVYGTWSQAQGQGQVKVKGEPVFVACTNSVVMMPIPYCSLSLLVLPYPTPVFKQIPSYRCPSPSFSPAAPCPFPASVGLLLPQSSYPLPELIKVLQGRDVQDYQSALKAIVETLSPRLLDL